MAVAPEPSLFAFRFPERERKEMVPLMEAFCALRRAVVETYTALAADIPFVIAAAQAALQLLSHLVKHMKERTAPKPH